MDVARRLLLLPTRQRFFPRARLFYRRFLRFQPISGLTRLTWIHSKA